MGGEADAADAPIPLPAPRHLHAAPRFEGGLQLLGKVDAMDRQTIHPIHGEALKAQRQLRLKGRRIVLGRDLGLQDPLGIGDLGQQPAKLAF